ncbi:SURF1 family cytochrome oxidase biogenesis protein [Leptospira venezuelensis]|uniref:SURF1 family cytochrome oxidase biogenesis protein n=1 Tax=Leptospira venezuelensis TaxID=1958811 RepID=UPI0012FF9CFF|nr:SURF1 family cytochrome oxidase biogenesis protein [Leptospira venezuelensis]
MKIFKPVPPIENSTQIKKQKAYRIKGLKSTKLSANRLVVIRGYFHSAEVLVPGKKDNMDGYWIIKPFTYVRERNPSLGWPYWAALDAVLINVGWIPSEGTNHFYKSLKYDPYFEESVEIRGITTNLIGTENANLKILLEQMNQQVIEDKVPPIVGSEKGFHPLLINLI